MKKTITARTGLNQLTIGCALSLGTLAAAQAHELDETTVLATGFKTGSEETGVRVYVAPGDAFNDLGIYRLNDAVLFSPGVNIFSNGGYGTVSSIFTRGTESDHTAIFVDGVKLTDSRVFPYPASNILSGGSFRAGERFELLRGPQSAMHGSDAIGGVLGISLEKGGEAMGNRAWLELGSFNSVQAGLRFQGREGKLSYNSVFSLTDTANDRARNDYLGLNAGIRVDYDLSDTSSIGATLRVMQFETEVPPLGFTPFALNETENVIYSAWYEHKLTDSWYSRISIGGYQSDFTNTGGFGDSKVNTERFQLEWKNRYDWTDRHETTAGVAVSWLDTRNTGASIAEKSERNSSVFLQHRWHQRDEFSLLGGLRHDSYDDGEDSTTFRVAGMYKVNETVELHGSVASGFRRPSVVDLYGFFGSGGNLNLRSETSLGWDAGARFTINETSGIDITYFQNDIDELISFGPAFTAMNIQEARTRGVEVSYDAKWLQDRVETRLAYTWLEADNLTNGTRLLRRPRHTLNADVKVTVTDKVTVGAGVTWVADREDVDAFTFAAKDAEDYLTARLFGRWQVNENTTLHARIENLTDEKFSEVDGFPARGRGIFAGITVKW